MALRTWQEVVAAYKDLEPRSTTWMFRGQHDASWVLESSLERAVVRRFQRETRDIPDYEHRLCRSFRRHYFKYSGHHPVNTKDRIEWLSIMQHHGAPTRLLDWTYSFYVALFFAIENVLPDHSCSVWALDQVKAWNLVKARFPAETSNKDEARDAALTTILDSRELLVCPVNPFYMNERLTVQQGVFLAPCNAAATFKENFDQSVGRDTSAWERLDIECSKNFLRDAFGELHRMNVTRAALFPGLDGFAVGLAHTIPLDNMWVGV